MTAKLELRKHARAMRAKLVASDFAQTIAAFADALDLPPHSIVAGYRPIRDEADPRALMKALSVRGHTLALPRIESKDAVLTFRRWNEGDDSAKGRSSSLRNHSRRRNVGRFGSFSRIGNQFLLQGWSPATDSQIR